MGFTLPFLALLVYISIIGLAFWMAWQLVQACVRIARSLEEIAAVYRSAQTDDTDAP